MPELPEVETIRGQLAPLVEGRKLLSLEILDPRWPRPLAPQELTDALQGRRIESLGRRGKYLLWNFSGDVHLAQHLRMTGAVLADPAEEPAHTRVRIELGPRPIRRLAIVDPRRFGTGELLLGTDAVEAFFAARLGLEPFDERFTGTHLRALMRGRSAPIKAMLLDQRRIAGVGNIYADESLWGAKIHPSTLVKSISLAEFSRLFTELQFVLNLAIQKGGSSNHTYVNAEGKKGNYMDFARVFRREGQACPRCGTTIIKFRVAGRGTHICPKCQKI